MSYSEEQFENAVQRFGEVFFVLDSGEQYIVHGREGYELENGIARVDGMRGDEYIIAEFPLDAIEHHYTHREV